jgi:hypothetical protein
MRMTESSIPRSPARPKPFLEFAKEFVLEHHRSCYSKKQATTRLSRVLLKRPTWLPLSALPDEDLRRFAKGFVEQFWPVPGLWREGFVDESKDHILVQYGGVLDDEPEAVEVALLGPDPDEPDAGVILEFLPIPGVDEETAEGHRNGTTRNIEYIFEGEPAWEYALHHCGSGANLYSSLRFVGLAGRSGEWRGQQWKMRLAEEQ